MGTRGPQKVKRYALEFKLKAVEMSNQPGVLIQDVAESLCIHPFMLSRWRKEVKRPGFHGGSNTGEWSHEEVRKIFA